MTDHLHFFRRIACCRLPTKYGEFTMIGYQNDEGQEHAALVVGRVDDSAPVMVRIHSECLTGDAFSSRRCDCGPQLNAAMSHIQKEGRGVIVYLRQEGRGIGLINKIRAYALQDEGMDTVEANLALHLPVDARSFVPAKEILSDLGVRRVLLMTNNPDKINTLRNEGIDVVRRIPLQVGVHGGNRHYLAVKAQKMGHMIDQRLLSEDAEMPCQNGEQT